MLENKRFQNKKLNKSDHEDINMAARRTKKILGSAGVATLVVSVVKKHGKTGLNMAKNIISKR